jgi:predicted nucleotidyltransferase
MNRQQYNQYNMTQYNDYQQPNTSHYSQQQQQHQGWFTDQHHQQNYNFGNNQNYNHPYAHHQNQQHRNHRQNYSRPNNYQQNYQPPQQHNYNYANGNFQQPQNSNYQKWPNNNKKKRSHDFVEPAQPSIQHCPTTSPEPKRQLQRQNSVPNMHQPAAAYQTQAPNAPAWKTAQQKQQQQQQQQQQSPQKKKKGFNHMEAFHEQKAKEWTEMFAKTMGLLKGCQAGEEAQILISNLQPSRNLWVKTKEQIFNDLSKVMTPLGIDKILVFGSTLTGLDFHGSDLDFFIQLKKTPPNEDGIRDALRKAARLTRDYLQGHDFYVVCTIPNARVPLLKLMHKQTRVSCDVNFNSRFGYYNSYFIGHILGYDKRIKELAVILKLWSKSYRIASQMILSNYCLMMLMIFYLQNLENPMLKRV